MTPRKPVRRVTRGTVSRIELEGGFFGIITDSREKLYPVNLGKEYQVDGLRIGFVESGESVFSIQMWGRAVSVDQVEKID